MSHMSVPPPRPVTDAGVGFSGTNLIDLLHERSSELGDRRLYTFLSDGERPEEHLSYAGLERRARAIGSALARQGVKPGERALLLYPPGLELVAAF